MTSILLILAVVLLLVHVFDSQRMPLWPTVACLICLLWGK